MKKHAPFLLAALLLLAEGVDVPLFVADKEIFLKKRNGTTAFCVGAHNHAEAARVVGFFLESKPPIKQAAPEEEFRRGDFLDTLPFLIQAYVFELLESANDAMRFSECAHEILCDLYDRESKPNKGIKRGKEEDVFNRLFIPVSVHSTPLYFECVEDAQRIADRYTVPFASAAQIPRHQTLQQYTRRLETPEADAPHANSSMEAGIYALFCCLAYDPKTRITRKKVKNPSEDLQRFFEKYREPVEHIPYRMHKEWNNVVSGLGRRRFIQQENGRVFRT